MLESAPTVIPENPAGIPEPVRYGGCLPSVFSQVQMAGRFCVPTLRAPAGLRAGLVTTVAVRRLPVSSFGDGRNDLTPDKGSLDGLVLGGIFDDHRQTWPLGTPVTAAVGVGEL